MSEDGQCRDRNHAGLRMLTGPPSMWHPSEGPTPEMGQDVALLAARMRALYARSIRDVLPGLADQLSVADRDFAPDQRPREHHDEARDRIVVEALEAAKKRLERAVEVWSRPDAAALDLVNRALKAMGK